MEDKSLMGKSVDRMKRKQVGMYSVVFYNGGLYSQSVVRAWRLGKYPTIVRMDPYPSWQVFEGDYDVGLELFNSLRTEADIERRCEPRLRNPMLTRNEEAVEHRQSMEEEKENEKK